MKFPCYANFFVRIFCSSVTWNSFIFILGLQYLSRRLSRNCRYCKQPSVDAITNIFSRYLVADPVVLLILLLLVAFQQYSLFHLSAFKRYKFIDLTDVVVLLIAQLSFMFYLKCSLIRLYVHVLLPETRAWATA